MAENVKKIDKVEDKFDDTVTLAPNVKVTVTLGKSHVDSGVDYKAGDSFETDALTARYIVTQKIGRVA